MLPFKRLCIPRRTLWRYTNVVLLLLLLLLLFNGLFSCESSSAGNVSILSSACKKVSSNIWLNTLPHHSIERITRAGSLFITEALAQIRGRLAACLSRGFTSNSTQNWSLPRCMILWLVTGNEDYWNRFITGWTLLQRRNVSVDGLERKHAAPKFTTYMSSSLVLYMTQGILYDASNWRSHVNKQIFLTEKVINNQRNKRAIPIHRLHTTDKCTTITVPVSMS